ncbi:MAG: hypothetical protein J6M57_06155 [Acidaminococcaceae bacterium]|nr:hypothetical protein [Acidaminococcaceae bacterium]MBO6265573.1 hypothetical protein [Acidaminococcaceae bacterium]MBQ5345343.1 hypothetical protein [Acidaminococcaceae bacterium]
MGNSVLGRLPYFLLDGDKVTPHIKLCATTSEKEKSPNKAEMFQLASGIFCLSSYSVILPAQNGKKLLLTLSLQ